jgi:hypothetical protein
LFKMLASPPALNFHLSRTIQVEQLERHQQLPNQQPHNHLGLSTPSTIQET